MKPCFCKCSQCNGGRFWIQLPYLNLWPIDIRSSYFLSYDDRFLWIRFPNWSRKCIPHVIMEANDWDKKKIY